MKNIRIAIVGYGKMGRRIEALCSDYGMQVEVIIDNQEHWDASQDLISGCDVALEFSTPDAAPDNIKRMLSAGVPVVSGTTGWDHLIPDAADMAIEKGLGLMIASNFSIGMNILFGLNRSLAKWMRDFPEYSASIKEIHHVHKLDAPSGTAISLVHGLMKEYPRYTGWAPASPGVSSHQLPVTSVREGEVVGVHEVKYGGPSDSITLKHEAFNRDGFVTGALAAARWIIGKKGLCTMEQMLFDDKNQ